MKSVFNKEKVELGLKVEKNDDQAIGTWKRHFHALKDLQQSDGYQILSQYFELHRETVIQQMIDASKSTTNPVEWSRNMIFFLNGFEQSVKLVDAVIDKLEKQIDKFEAEAEEVQYARSDE